MIYSHCRIYKWILLRMLRLHFTGIQSYSILSIWWRHLSNSFTKTWLWVNWRSCIQVRASRGLAEQLRAWHKNIDDGEGNNKNIKYVPPKSSIPIKSSLISFTKMQICPWANLGFGGKEGRQVWGTTASFPSGLMCIRTECFLFPVHIFSVCTFAKITFRHGLSIEGFRVSQLPEAGHA